LKYPVNIPELTNHIGIVFLLLCFSCTVVSSQNRNDLEKQRQRLIQEIQDTEQALNKTKENKAVTLDQYLALQSQIQKRRALIATLKEEIDISNQGIEEAHQQLAELGVELSRLKEEYAHTIRQAYRLKLNNSFLLFIFSADSFDDAYRRWQYLRQYDSNRKRQAQEIIKTQTTLTEKSQRLEKQKIEKEQLLVSQQQQNNLLRNELDEKNAILKKLNTSEGKLIAELDKQQKAHDELNDAIEKIIRNEMANRARSGRTNTSPSATPDLNNTPESDAPLSNNFNQNKGKIPWPVKKGYITRRFGKQPHPQVRSIQITNNGIDIRTDPKAQVHAVFEGTVAGTQFIPGYQNTIIIKHGEYYTAYSNLEQIYVKRGDAITADKVIGKVGSKKPEVHFEIWKGKKRLNPSNWVVQG
jgi:septal ring factor EnvC (AmiA/AmiB activator)